MTAPADLPLRQRDYLLRIARAMSAELDPRVVLALVIRSAVAMTAGQAGAITMRRTADGPFEVVAGHRLTGELRRALERLDASPPGPVDPAMSAADRAPGSGPDDPDARPAAAIVSLPARVREPAGDGDPTTPEAPTHVLTLPLRRGETTIGRIVVFRGEGAAVFTPLDEDLLAAFADQAAVAIQNAMLHQRLATRERQLARVLGHAASGLMVLDHGGLVLHANAAAARLVGRSPVELARADAREVLALETDTGVPLPLPLPDRPDATTSARGRLSRRTGGAPGPWVQVALTAIGHGAEDEAGEADGAVEGYVADIADLTAWREAEHAKSAFLGGLSHELKTPLALIRGYAETLAGADPTADAGFVAEATGIIVEEAERLTRLVDALLEAARLEGGGLRLDVADVALGPLLERLVEGFRAAHPGRAWRLDADEGLPPIAGDAERLRDAFAELLANADKYAAPGEAVTIGARAVDGGDAVEVRVADRGPGIAARDLPHLFERFYRSADHAERRRGAGLGLHLVRAVVEAHGGTIAVASTPGAGSAFTVRLPRRARERAARRLAAPPATAPDAAEATP